MPFFWPIIVRFINLVAYIIPAISVKVSYFFWTSTYRYKRPKREDEWWHSAIKETRMINGKKVAIYRWEEKSGDSSNNNLNREKPILLLHGWNGRATQMCSFIPGLFSQGYSVIGFDAIGHGASDGKHTNILETVDVIEQLEREYKGFSAIIGHSFGVLAAINAISRNRNRNRIRCKVLVGVSPVLEFMGIFTAFVEWAGLNYRARQALEAYLLIKFKILTLDEISINQIADVNDLAILILHDKSDDKIALDSVQKKVQEISGAKLHITEKLGHTRILRNQAVVELAIDFINKNPDSLT